MDKRKTINCKISRLKLGKLPQFKREKNRATITMKYWDTVKNSFLDEDGEGNWVSQFAYFQPALRNSNLQQTLNEKLLLKYFINVMNLGISLLSKENLFCMPKHENTKNLP